MLWTDGPRVSGMLDELVAEDFAVSTPGKGRAVWMAFGYLLADPKLEAFVLHDCDIVDYDRELLIRLCLPMAHPSLDFDFCKAYYARCTTKMHGRVVRLLVSPLLQALFAVLGHHPFLEFLGAFRYPLAGEFAVTSRLARSNRIPSDWGLEVGTLAEVYRNASQKRVCQVDLGRLYEHKHQPLSLEDPKRGLMKMVGDILASVVRTLASQGVVFTRGHFISIRAAYLRAAQDAIRQYHADALLNNLDFDRHIEENAVEGFAEQITLTGDEVYNDPSGFASMPTWTRVLAALPDFPAASARPPPPTGRSTPPTSWHRKARRGENRGQGAATPRATRRNREGLPCSASLRSVSSSPWLLQRVKSLNPRNRRTPRKPERLSRRSSASRSRWAARWWVTWGRKNQPRRHLPTGSTPKPAEKTALCWYCDGRRSTWT